jgi:hypothetical protein
MVVFSNLFKYKKPGSMIDPFLIEKQNRITVALQWPVAISEIFDVLQCFILCQPGRVSFLAARMAPFPGWGSSVQSFSWNTVLPSLSGE